jgi:glycosyltransferase EpsF
MKNKLHVLQVTGVMNRGGAEVMLMDFYRNISSDVHFDFLVNRREKDTGVIGDFDEEILQKGATIKYIGTQWELGISKYIKAFKKVIQEIGKPDVVHIHLNAKCGVIALAAHRCGIKKIIAHSHADLKFRGSFFKVLLAKVELHFQKFLIARYATDFWGCSQPAIESLYYRRLLKSGKSAIINNAVDVSVFQSVSQDTINTLKHELGINENTLVIGNVGRVVRHKKVDFIIDILKVLVDKNVECKFIFAGRSDDKAYMDEINNKVQKYNLNSRVIHLGDRGDIPSVISTFSVFAGPALKEGFGLVAVEAQAAGIPCVLYTGFPKSVDMGLNLVTFLDNFDAKIWADELLKSAKNKCRNKEQIKRKITEKGYDIVENTKRIELLYLQ